MIAINARIDVDIGEFERPSCLKAPALPAKEFRPFAYMAAK